MVKASGVTVKVPGALLMVWSLAVASLAVMLYGLPATWLAAVAVVVRVGCVVRLEIGRALSRARGEKSEVGGSLKKELVLLSAEMVKATGGAVKVPGA